MMLLPRDADEQADTSDPACIDARTGGDARRDRREEKWSSEIVCCGALQGLVAHVDRDAGDAARHAGRGDGDAALGSITETIHNERAMDILRCFNRLRGMAHWHGDWSATEVSS